MQSSSPALRILFVCYSTILALQAVHAQTLLSTSSPITPTWIYTQKIASSNLRSPCATPPPCYFQPPTLQTLNSVPSNFAYLRPLPNPGASDPNNPSSPAHIDLQWTPATPSTLTYLDLPPTAPQGTRRILNTAKLRTTAPQYSASIDLSSLMLPPVQRHLDFRILDDHVEVWGAPLAGAAPLQAQHNYSPLYTTKPPTLAEPLNHGTLTVLFTAATDTNTPDYSDLLIDWGPLSAAPTLHSRTYYNTPIPKDPLLLKWTDTSNRSHTQQITIPADLSTYSKNGARLTFKIPHKGDTVELWLDTLPPFNTSAPNQFPAYNPPVQLSLKTASN